MSNTSKPLICANASLVFLKNVRPKNTLLHNRFVVVVVVVVVTGSSESSFGEELSPVVER